MQSLEPGQSLRSVCHDIRLMVGPTSPWPSGFEKSSLASGTNPRPFCESSRSGAVRTNLCAVYINHKWAFIEPFFACSWAELPRRKKKKEEENLPP